MADSRSLGQIVDDLDITIEVDEGQLVEAAIVVMKMLDPDGGVWLKIRWHDGLDLFTRLGMLRAAAIDAENDFVHSEDE